MVKQLLFLTLVVISVYASPAPRRYRRQIEHSPGFPGIGTGGDGGNGGNGGNGFKPASNDDVASTGNGAPSQSGIAAELVSGVKAGLGAVLNIGTNAIGKLVPKKY